MKDRLSKAGLLEDIAETGKSGIHTMGFALSYLGLKYINEIILGNSVQIPLSGDTPLFSSEFGFYAAQFICALGTGVEGIRCIYNTIKIPVKFITRKYSKRDNSENGSNERNIGPKNFKQERLPN